MTRFPLKDLFFIVILLTFLAPVAARAEVGSKVLVIENLLHQIYFGSASAGHESSESKENKKNSIKQGVLSVRLPTDEEMKVIRAAPILYDSSGWQQPDNDDSDDSDDSDDKSATSTPKPALFSLDFRPTTRIQTAAMVTYYTAPKVGQADKTKSAKALQPPNRAGLEDIAGGKTIALPRSFTQQPGQQMAQDNRNLFFPINAEFQYSENRAIVDYLIRDQYHRAPTARFAVIKYDDESLDIEAVYFPVIDFETPGRGLDNMIGRMIGKIGKLDEEEDNEVEFISSFYENEYNEFNPQAYQRLTTALADRYSNQPIETQRPAPRQNDQDINSVLSSQMPQYVPDAFFLGHQITKINNLIFNDNFNAPGWDYGCYGRNAKNEIEDFHYANIPAADEGRSIITSRLDQGVYVRFMTRHTEFDDGETRNLFYLLDMAVIAPPSGGYYPGSIEECEKARIKTYSETAKSYVANLSSMTSAFLTNQFAKLVPGNKNNANDNK